jgi:hypothetical protein
MSEPKVYCKCRVVYPWSYYRDRPAIEFCELHKDPVVVVTILNAYVNA